MKITNKMVVQHLLEFLSKHKETPDFFVGDFIETHYWTLREKINGKEDVYKYLPFLDSQLPKMSDARQDKIFELLEVEFDKTKGDDMIVLNAKEKEVLQAIIKNNRTKHEDNVSWFEKKSILKITSFSKEEIEGLISSLNAKSIICVASKDHNTSFHYEYEYWALTDKGKEMSDFMSTLKTQED